jgi:murein DD-endopeptidase MepM/ murein hydrolase activator NlpD
MALSPLFAQAGVLSGFTALFERAVSSASASGGNLNSQTIPLLQPAVNLDPNPSIGGGNITLADGAALVPVDSPAGTPADVEERPQSSQISVYTVRDGDTLSDIADMFGVSVNTIIWANDIEGRVIHPGQVLVILPITGLRHTVAKGETLASLAKAYGADAAEIASYNELSADASLAAGQVVIIPHGEAAAASSPKPSSSGSGSAKPTAPLKGAGGPTYAGYYGYPVSGIITQSLHGYNGIDIGAPQGTPIVAAAAGTVIVARDNGGWNGGYGNYVVIQHPNGTQTLYAHATTGTVRVSVGDSVERGQQLASVGRTGEATGFHLHFEVRGASNPLGSLPVGKRI